jgi:DNA-binding transcriptional MerR regulator
MTYTVGALSRLAGVSARTLRYYDRLGLLRPETISASGYRVYGETQVNRLQQILFYRELGVELSTIREILDAPSFVQEEALEGHMKALTARRDRLSALIETVKRTMAAQKGGISMADEEKFAAFKQNLIAENERRYGAEVRSRYGDEAAAQYNAKLMAMTKEQYENTEALSQAVNEAIRTAFDAGDPRGELARKACELHKEWLMRYWTQYSPEAHMGLAQGYVDDPRFRAYYDAIKPGCAQFLRDAIFAYCGK